MSQRSDEFRKEVNKLWAHAIDQLEELRDGVLRTNDRVETEIQRLREERDKLLRRLGEQTFKLANRQTIPLPSVVRRTVKQLNDVLESLTSVELGRKKKPKKKTSGKKTSASSKKTTKAKARRKKTTGASAPSVDE